MNHIRIEVVDINILLLPSLFNLFEKKLINKCEKNLKNLEFIDQTGVNITSDP